ncbi:hypothetical protein Maes01_01371 [Microbulbifer aestuariivivens]|uniref:LapD/MoxY periplasmic domain-containing protein n=1 Tax=Microbulbifer aestuariivivens TaxID=1908308 RepID=A0ABP9WNM3_9GAMM
MERPIAPARLARLHPLALAVVLLLALGGGLWLSMATTRDYLQTELQGTARDSANTLALALRPYLIEGDSLSLDTAVTALVQSGHYRAISIQNTQGGILVKRESPTLHLPVPDWFIRRINLHAPAATANIDYDWRVIAEVTAEIHPAPAQQQLWRLAIGYCGLFIASAALTLLFTLRVQARTVQSSASETNHFMPLGNRQEFEAQLRRSRRTRDTREEYWLLVDTGSNRAPPPNEANPAEAGNTLPELLRAHLENWPSALALYHLGGHQYAIYLHEGHQAAACGLAGWLCAVIGASQPAHWQTMSAATTSRSSANLNPIPNASRGLRVVVMPLSVSVSQRAAIEHFKWALTQARRLRPFQWGVYQQHSAQQKQPEQPKGVRQPMKTQTVSQRVATAGNQTQTGESASAADKSDNYQKV